MDFNSMFLLTRDIRNRVWIKFYRGGTEIIECRISCVVLSLCYLEYYCTDLKSAFFCDFKVFTENFGELLNFLKLAKKSNFASKSTINAT